MSRQPFLVLDSNDIEPFTHPDEPGYHSQHVLGREITGGHDLLLNRGTVDPDYDLGGGNHPDNDEIYFAVSGEALVDLGGDPDTGEGHTTYTLREGGVVFVPAGTFHRLRNRSERPFVLLTIWPQPATRGANGIHDARLDTWGTGLRFRDGCGIRSVNDDGGRVVTPDHDPLVSVA
jgi:mannose-6-phosphate isomerase-like protein (cupin superfamily)